ncbi:MAG TPA: carboxypeptidase-like regulatory domain-containing protein [Bryobacteraceae bacterium]|jgi:hypothetical protein
MRTTALFCGSFPPGHNTGNSRQSLLSSTAAVNSAHISITSKATGAVRGVTANDDGLYEAVNIPPGEYTVRVEATGFSAATRDVTTEVGQHMDLDFALTVGEQHNAL